MSRSRLLASALTSAVIVFLSCGCTKKDDKAGVDPASSAKTTAAAPAKASCDLLDQIGVCTEYAKLEAAALEKSLCEGLKGRWKEGPCPTDGVVGSCAMTGGDTKRYYKTFQELKSFTVEEAEADCQSELVKGVFTASPNAPRKPPPKAEATGSAPKVEPSASAAAPSKPQIDPQKPSLKVAPNAAPQKPVPALDSRQ
ncbi:MAG: hypothetical protein JNL38_31970 [Myxococcales bacterium]|jgi:hypothetical protein|nr:hypothetical protein [Myxococcales bacterium]